MVSEGSSRHFEWDYADQMRVYRTQTGTSIPSEYAHYLYDAAGNRVKKIVRKQGGDSVVSVYIDGGFEHLYKRSSGGTKSEEHNELQVMDGRSRIASVRVGTAFGLDTSPVMRYNIDDHLGNASFTLDTTGSLTHREEYFPFGETSFGSYSKKRYRFCGKERDEESGLYYYGARYYMPWQCRFVSVDPLAGEYPFYTPYQYAGNQPIIAIDLDGLEPAFTGDHEGQKATTMESSTEMVTTSHFGMQYKTEVVHAVHSVWQAGTEENDFEDSGWMTKSEYNRFIFQRTADRATQLNDYDGLVPWLYPREKFDAPGIYDLGLDLNHAGGAFFLAYNAAEEYLENPQSQSQGIVNMDFEVWTTAVDGYLFTKWAANGVKFLVSNTMKTEAPVKVWSTRSLGDNTSAVKKGTNAGKRTENFSVISHGDKNGKMMARTADGPRSVSVGTVWKGMQQAGYNGEPIDFMVCHGAKSAGPDLLRLSGAPYMIASTRTISASIWSFRSKGWVQLQMKGDKIISIGPSLDLIGKSARRIPPFF
jgi:RHS repeat-associated protein